MSYLRNLTVEDLFGIIRFNSIESATIQSVDVIKKINLNYKYQVTDCITFKSNEESKKTAHQF